MILREEVSIDDHSAFAIRRDVINHYFSSANWYHLFFHIILNTFLLTYREQRLC